VPQQDRNARNAASAPGAALSRSLNLEKTDEVPQRTLDRILWRAVHGRHSTPPPPGPGAEREAPGDPDG
jgi:hypothetical protein